MTTFKKVARSAILALVLLGSAAGGTMFATHQSITFADSSGGHDNLDAG